MNVNQLSRRLERLERENRWMKRAGIAVVGIALAVALIGATRPEDIPEMIEAQAFRVIDEDGTQRAFVCQKTAYGAVAAFHSLSSFTHRRAISSEYSSLPSG